MDVVGCITFVEYMAVALKRKTRLITVSVLVYGHFSV